MYSTYLNKSLVTTVMRTNKRALSRMDLQVPFKVAPAREWLLAACYITDMEVGALLLLLLTSTESLICILAFRMRRYTFIRLWYYQSCLG